MFQVTDSQVADAEEEKNCEDSFFGDLEQQAWSFTEWTNVPLRAAAELDNGLGSKESGNSSEDSSSCNNLTSENEYIRRLLHSADLHLLKPGLVNAAYDKPGSASFPLILHKVIPGRRP